ncbi:hypothetical protein [Aureimonas sp. AU20]|uniref:hypothetical protein n=1 Tax=Aureimonas sp. AU20 TaxID=1349819 RepID=UPI0007214CC9|nr:hypothetical protein [Aureimonas sp. AU20]ALN73515.1 hypothetical protein M673_12395 [Aureimonas sp. AU20]
MAVLALLRSALMILVGLCFGALGATIYASFVTVPDARLAGRQEERGIWQEAQRQAEAQREAERQAAQAQIDQIERDYHQRDAERTARMSALEAALEQEQTDVDQTPPPVAGSAPVCRPAVPRRLRDALDGIGRSTPADRAPVPSPAVR